MITITNQAEFDSVFVTNIAYFPQNEIVRIIPNPEGFYEVRAPIIINKSNAIIQGYGSIRPILKYTGVAQTSDTGIFSFNGTSASQLENIVVEYLNLDEVNKTKRYVNGIYCSYVGLAQTTGLSSGGYDASTVGKDKPNKIGICVKDCIIQNNNDNGISLYNSSNNTITGNTVQNNLDGISLYNSSNNTITGNTFQDNRSGGIWLNSSPNNNTIIGNTVQNNGFNGITLSASSNNNTITGNTVQNNGFNGIHLRDSSNSTVTGNTVQNNDDNGIYLNSSSNNNTITGNKYTSIEIGGTTTGNLNSLSYNQVIA